MAVFNPISFERVTDAAGVPVSGAKLYVYDAGTSNLAEVWTDAAGATPGANPIVADSAGQFPNRYLDDGTYDYKYTTSADVQIGPTREDIVIASTSGGGGSGGDTFDVIVKISNYTITAADVADKIPVFRCDASGIPGGEMIVTASAADLGVDKSFFVINTGLTGTIRIQPDVGETIDGDSDVTLTGQGRGAGYVCIGAAGWETISTTSIQQTKLVVSATPSTDQTDFTSAGLSDAVDFKQINLAPTASINFNSIAGISEGERVTIANTLDGTGALGRLIILPHEHAASTSGNRFFFPDRMARFLLPGDAITFVKFGSRLRPASRDRFQDVFDVYSDCHNMGPYSGDVSGSGASSSATFSSNAQFGDTTQKPQGVVALLTGTTSTGGASYGSVSDSGTPGEASIAPAQGQALAFARLRANALSTGAQEFSIRTGFHDAIPVSTDVTDGIYWEYLRTAATQWSFNCAGAGSRSKTASGVTVDTNYVHLGIYITGDWSQADFFISQDGRTWTIAGSQTGANMPVSTELCDMRTTMKKSVGGTNVSTHIDMQGHRYDAYRGAA